MALSSSRPGRRPFKAVSGVQFSVGLLMKYHKIIAKSYQDLLDKMIDELGDEFEDVLIQVTTFTGETIRFSWKDRESRLLEQEK